MEIIINKKFTNALCNFKGAFVDFLLDSKN